MNDNLDETEDLEWGNPEDYKLLYQIAKGGYSKVKFCKKFRKIRLKDYFIE